MTDMATRMAQAMADHQAGRVDAAAEGYAAMLAIDERQVPARHNLGMLRLGQGRVAEALALLSRALIEDPANAGWGQSLPLVGMTLFEQGHWEVALSWLERAIASGCQDARVIDAAARIRPRDYVAPEVFDAALGRVLKRQAPRESAHYVYAIDVAGTCNLRCPTCPVGNSPLGARRRSFMAPALFSQIVAKIVAECPCPTPELFLFNWGEPLLHPQLAEIVGIARQAGLATCLSTNLNVENGLRELAKANPSTLKISLSGFTAETYARTHARGNFALVRSNLFRLRYYLDRYKATTRVWVGHHLYRSNQAQLPEVAAACRELGFEHHPIAAFFQPLERLIDVVDGRLDAPIVDDLLEHPRSYVPRFAATKSGHYDCELRFNQTAINADGSVALCCNVYDDANMLGASFLDHDHDALQAMKYAHPFCQTCYARGLQYAPADMVHEPADDRASSAR